MANENKDVIRVETTKALMATTIRNQQIGFTSDTDEIAYKDSGGSMNYWTSGADVDVTDIEISDNTTNAFRVRYSTDEYINIDTTDGSEYITFGVGYVVIEEELTVDGGYIWTNNTATDLVILNNDSEAFVIKQDDEPPFAMMTFSTATGDTFIQFDADLECNNPVNCYDELNVAGESTFSNDVSVLSSDIILNDGGTIYLGDAQDTYIQHSSPGGNDAISIINDASSGDIFITTASGGVKLKSAGSTYIYDNSSVTQVVVNSGGFYSYNNAHFRDNTLYLTTAENAWISGYTDGSYESVYIVSNTGASGNIYLGPDVPGTYDPDILLYGASIKLYESGNEVLKVGSTGVTAYDDFELDSCDLVVGGKVNLGNSSYYIQVDSTTLEIISNADTYDIKIGAETTVTDCEIEVTGSVIELKYSTNNRVEINSTGMGFFSATPVAQPSSVGETTGFAAGTGTAANDDSTFTGNSGTKAYTVGDIVKHLKALGLLAAS